MNKTLTIKLSRLSEGHMRTVVRELNVIIEDYCWKKAMCECISVTEEK